MARYVIDIPNDKEYAYVNDEKTFLRIPISLGENKIKSISALTFLRMTPCTEPDRKAIEDEVWEFAKKLISMSGNEVSEMWGYATNFGEVMYNTTYSEAKAKYEAWQKQRDEIRVGDEVTICGQKRVVTSIDDKDTMAIDSDGNTYCFRSMGFRKEATKTGRHFPEIAELLKKMKEEYL